VTGLDLAETGALSSSSRALHRVLGGGVAFQNADLSREERSTLEEQFRDRTSCLKVSVATPR